MEEGKRLRNGIKEESGSETKDEEGGMEEGKSNMMETRNWERKRKEVMKGWKKEGNREVK